MFLVIDCVVIEKPPTNEWITSSNQITARNSSNRFTKHKRGVIEKEQSFFCNIVPILEFHINFFFMINNYLPKIRCFEMFLNLSYGNLYDNSMVFQVLNLI